MASTDSDQTEITNVAAELDMEHAIDCISERIEKHLSVTPVRSSASITAPYNFQPVFWDPDKIHAFHMMCKTSTGLWTEWIPSICKQGKVVS